MNDKSLIKNYLKLFFLKVTNRFPSEQELNILLDHFKTSQKLNNTIDKARNKLMALDGKTPSSMELARY